MNFGLDIGDLNEDRISFKPDDSLKLVINLFFRYFNILNIVLIFLSIHVMSNMSVQAACLIIIAFMYRHSLFKVAQTDLINLIHLLLPNENNLPKSI